MFARAEAEVENLSSDLLRSSRGEGGRGTSKADASYSEAAIDDDDCGGRSMFFFVMRSRNEGLAESRGRRPSCIHLAW